MRAFVFIVLFIVLALIGVGVYVYLNAGSLVEQAIETYGTRAAGTEVAVDSVDIEIVQRTAAINGFTIDNPAGFSNGDAFSLDQISVSIDPEQMSQDLIVLTEVIVNNPQVLYEYGQNGTNIDAIRANIESYQRSLSGGGGSGAGGDEGPGAKMIIDRLHFTGGTVVATAAGETVMVDLPPLTLTNIGRASGGETAAQIAVQVGERFTRHVSETVARSRIERELGLDEGVVDRVRDLFGQ